MLLAAALVRVAGLGLPLDPEEGELASLAWLWRGGQGLAYRDFLAQDPPLPSALYAAAQGLLSDSVMGLRAAALIWQLATAAALCLLARRWFGERAALFAGLCFAVFSQGLGLAGLSARAGFFATLPLLLGARALTRPKGPRWMLSGAFLGAAALASLNSLALLPLFALLPGPRGRERLRAAWLLGLGASLPWIFCFAFFATQGAAAQFWDCVISRPLGPSGAGRLWAWGRAWAGLAPEQAGLWLAAALGLWKLRALAPGPQRAALWFWLLGAALAPLLGGRLGADALLPLAAPLSLAAAAALDALSTAWKRAALALAALLPFAAAQAPLWSARGAEERTIAAQGNTLALRVEDAALYLRERSPEGSRVFVWGSEPQIYYLARRAPATRFLNADALRGLARAWPGGEEEVLRALEDPWTSGLIANPLDPRDPFQRRIVELMQKHYAPHLDVAPPLLLGLRKR